MKINYINAYIGTDISKQTKSATDVQFVRKNQYQNDSIIISGKPANNHFSRLISFLGEKLGIVDGGQHSKDFKYFAKAIMPNVELNSYVLEQNPNDPYVMQMESLKKQLDNIAKTAIIDNKQPDYIAIPVLCTVPLANLNDQIKAVTGKDLKLTPQNIKENTNEIMDFLHTISTNKDKYKKELGYMDKMGQGFEYLYEIITRINQLSDKGIQIFIPAGHPNFQTLKWITTEKNLKPELYRYLNTGKDNNCAIANLKNEIIENNWYDYNLLTLSKATSVNLSGKKGEKHLYSAYDSNIGATARGVYNFTPVREDGKIVGFSYFDDKTVNYPLSDFIERDGFNPEIFYLTKFVGKPLKDFIAPSQKASDLVKYKNLFGQEAAAKSSNFENKLFKVEDIFTKDEIKKNKISIKGDYVDSSLKRFYRVNSDGLVYFPNCDCEKSERPSVMSMWGSCFSVFTEIANKINEKNNKYYTSYDETPHEAHIENLYVFDYLKSDYVKHVDTLIRTKCEETVKNQAYYDYLNLVEELLKRNDKDGCRKFYQKAIDIKIAEKGEYDPSLYLNYLELASKYPNEENLKNYNKALEVLKANYGEHSKEAYVCYMNMGRDLFNKDYFKLGLESAINSFDKDDKELAYAYAKVANELNNEESEYYYNQAINILCRQGFISDDDRIAIGIMFNRINAQGIYYTECRNAAQSITGDIYFINGKDHYLTPLSPEGKVIIEKRRKGDMRSISTPEELEAAKNSKKEY